MPHSRRAPIDRAGSIEWCGRRATIAPPISAPSLACRPGNDNDNDNSNSNSNINININIKSIVIITTTIGVVTSAPSLPRDGQHPA